MRRALIALVLGVILLPLIRAAGFNLGMTQAVRKKVQALDGKAAQSEVKTAAAGPPAGPAVVAVTASSVTVVYETAAGAAGYVLNASTSASFAGTVYSAATSTPTINVLSLQNLDPNTTYYLQVGSVYGPSTLYASALATSTLAGPTPSPAVFAAFVTSATVRWAAVPQSPSSDTAEGYLLQASTAADFSGAVESSATANAAVDALTLAGLAFGTRYYFRVGSLDWDAVPNFVSAGSSVTQNGVVTARPDSAVSASGFTSSWGSNMPPGTVYYASLSTNNFATVNLTSATAALSATFGGSGASLLANTTYYARVALLPAGPYTSLGAVATLAAPPSAPAFAGVFIASVSVSWSALPQSPPSATAEGYVLQASTASDFSGTVYSSSTPNVALSTLTLSALASGTSYYFRVGSLNWASVADDGPVGSTVTQSSALYAQPYASVSSASLTAGWGTNFHSGTLYYATLSTNDFTTVNLTSVTANSSAVFGAGGAGPSLYANTTYYAEVSTQASGPYVPLGPVPTLAAPVSGSSFMRVSLTSVTVSWNALPQSPSSSAAEGYLLQASTAANFSGALYSSATPNVALNALTLSALAEETTYYFRVGSLNWGAAADFSSAGSTVTQSSPLYALPYTNVSSASLTTGWGSNFFPGTLYYASVSTNDFATVNLTSVTANSSAIFGSGGAGTPLYANTTYYTEVSTQASGPFLTLGSTSTLAAPATGFAFASVYITSVAVAWNALPSSPSSATAEGYLLQASTAADFSGTLYSSATPNVGLNALTLPALAAQTTYYFRVATLDWDSAADYSSAGSTVTRYSALAVQPYAAVSTASLAADWGSTFPPGTLYYASLSTNGFTTVNLTSVTANSSVLFGAGGAGPSLLANTTYYARVSTQSSGPFLSLGADSTLAFPASAPALAGVFYASVTVSWTGLPQSPSTGTAEGYVLQASTAADFSGTLYSSATTNVARTSLTLLSLPAGPCYFRVGSLNWDSVADFGAALTTATQSYFIAVQPYSGVSSVGLTAGWSSTFPQGTTYYTLLSTNNFTTTSLSTTTLILSQAFGSGGAGAPLPLSANTTYYAQVSTQSAGPFVALGSTVTWSIPPPYAAVSAVFFTSAAVSWTALPSAAAEGYLIQASTSPAFTGVLYSSAASNAAAGSLTVTGLASGTQYYFRAASLNWAGTADFAAAGAALTQNYSLYPQAFSAVSASSLTSGWGSSLSPGTQFYASLSTNDFATVNVTSATANLSAVFGAGGAGPALYANTTYYTEASTSTAGPSLVLGAISTLASATPSPAFSGVFFSSVAVSWTVLPQSPSSATAEGYLLQASTAANFSGVLYASSTPNVAVGTLTLTGLASAATYYFRVGSLDWGSVANFVPAGSTATPYAALYALPYAEVSTASLVSTWGSHLSAGTLYYVNLSTNAFATIDVATTTTGLFAVFGGTGTGPALLPDTTYYAEVSTQAAGPYVPLGPVMTCAAPVGADVTSMAASIQDLQGNVLTSILTDGHPLTYATLRLGTTVPGLLVDLGASTTVALQRVVFTGPTVLQLPVWPDYESYQGTPPQAIIRAYIGNSTNTTNLVGEYMVDYTQGNPVDMEADIRFQPTVGRYLRLQLETAVPWSTYAPGYWNWTNGSQSSLAWNVGELELYGFTGPNVLVKQDAVVVASTAAYPLQIAAQDLSYYLGALEGRPVPIVTFAQAPQYPGTQYAIDDLASLAPNYATMMTNIGNGSLPSGVNIVRNGNQVLFKSWPYRGVLLSAWQFLYQQGVRWLYPDAHGDYVPPGPRAIDLNVPLQYQPSASGIYANWDTNSLQPWPSGIAEATQRQGYLYPFRNGWNSTQGPGTAGNAILGGGEIPAAAENVSEINTVYPQYVAGGLLGSSGFDGFEGWPHNLTGADGVVPDAVVDSTQAWWGTNGSGTQVEPPSNGAYSASDPMFDMTADSPSVAAWVAGKIAVLSQYVPRASQDPLNLRYFDESFNLLPLDSMYFSNDAVSDAMNSPAEPDPVPWVSVYTNSQSGPYYSFISSVATQVAQLAPAGSTVTIGALAYADLFLPPQNIATLPGNVRVDVCMYGAPNLPTTSPVNAGLKAAFDGWHAAASQLGTYDYALLHTDAPQPNPVFPAALVSGLVDRAKYLAGIGALNGSVQGNPSSLPYNPWNFYAYPLIRVNVNQTAGQLESDFFKGYFKEAAAPMLAYYQAMENYQVQNNANLHIGGYAYGVTPGSFPDSLLQQMGSALAAAQSAAKSWVTSGRVANMVAGYDYVVSQRGLSSANPNTPTVYPIGQNNQTVTLNLANGVFNGDAALSTSSGWGGLSATNYAQWGWFSGGDAWESFDFSQGGTYNVTISARGADSSGANVSPIMYVYIGSQSLGSAAVALTGGSYGTIVPGDYQDYNFTINLPANYGVQDFLVTYDNAASGGARSLFIQSITITRASP